MNTENFEAFNRIALYTLVQLFESFPEPIELDAKRIGIDAKPKDEDETQEELWANINLGYWTISWLKDEGFIKADARTWAESRFCNARLTLKGLILLGYSAPSMDGEQDDVTFADRAKEVLAEGGRAAAVETVQEIFKNALRLGIGLMA